MANSALSPPASSQPSQQTPAKSGQGRGPSSIALKFCSIIILILILLVGLILIIIWLAIRPRHVIISVHDVYVHDYNLTHNHLNATFNLTLISKNRNRHVSFYYDSAKLSVIYDDQTLAQVTVPSFHQPRKNMTVVYVEAAARDLLLHDSVSRNLRIERTSGTVGLEVQIKAKIRFKVGVWKSNRRNVKITCAPVLVVFAHSRSFEETKCKVHI